MTISRGTSPSEMEGVVSIEETAKPAKEVKITDERLIGFVFPGANQQGKTPFDFARDPKTGRRHGGPSLFGVGKDDLRDGIEGATLPPLFIWKKGRWLSDFEPFDMPISNVQPKVLADRNGKTHPENKPPPREDWALRVWVVNGEGTPTDYPFRAYLVPASVASDQVPKHPVMWSKKLKEGKASSFVANTDPDWATAPPPGKDVEWYHASWELLDKGFNQKPLLRGTSAGWTGYGPYDSPLGRTTPPAVSSIAAKPVATVKASLPAGTRFRCRCGHWFKEGDLAGHAKVCPVENDEAQANWSVMCDDKCGCEFLKGFPTADHINGVKTLDHVSRPKPGFPIIHVKKEVAKTKVKESTSTEEVKATDPTVTTQVPVAG